MRARDIQHHQRLDVMAGEPERLEPRLEVCGRIEVMQLPFGGESLRLKCAELLLDPPPRVLGRETGERQQSLVGIALGEMASDVGQDLELVAGNARGATGICIAAEGLAAPIQGAIHPASSGNARRPKWPGAPQKRPPAASRARRSGSPPSR